jgi:hypothetical protein
MDQAMGRKGKKKQVLPACTAWNPSFVYSTLAVASEEHPLEEAGSTFVLPGILPLFTQQLWLLLQRNIHLRIWQSAVGKQGNSTWQNSQIGK